MRSRRLPRRRQNSAACSRCRPAVWCGAVPAPALGFLLSPGASAGICAGRGVDCSAAYKIVVSGSNRPRTCSALLRLLLMHRHSTSKLLTASQVEASDAQMLHLPSDAPDAPTPGAASAVRVVPQRAAAALAEAAPRRPSSIRSACAGRSNKGRSQKRAVHVQHFTLRSQVFACACFALTNGLTLPASHKLRRACGGGAAKAAQGGKAP